MSKALTTRSVESLKPDPVRRLEVPDGGSGLYCIVQPSGSKGWALRYRLHGKPKKLTLGKFPALSLADARAKAREALAVIDTGDDPAAEKQARREADTVAELAEDYLTRHASKLRSSDLYRRILEREVLPYWGNRKADSIRRRDVIDILDRIADRGSPSMADLVLSTIKSMFTWALSRDRLEVSPCAGVKPPSPKTVRDRILNDDELRAFWQATGEAGYPIGPAFRLMLMSGCRRGEIGDMAWREIDGATFTLPAERAKNGKELTVTLPDPALLILSSVPRTGPYVFSHDGERPIANYRDPHRRIARRMTEVIGAEVPHWTLHDLRRTAASGMARAGVQLPVIERCLNHVSGSFAGIVGVYQRHEFREEMADAWQRWAELLATITGEAPGSVVPLRGPRK